ncbi:MAG: hypothetical protein AB1589_45075 [Cyanobacteriota bacterium]
MSREYSECYELLCKPALKTVGCVTHTPYSTYSRKILGENRPSPIPSALPRCEAEGMYD